MTRARALKQVIRARVARTGERYTTARRHVLENVKSRPPAQTRPAPEPIVSAPAAPARAKRALGASDEKMVAKTGHGYDYWFAVLDRFDAVTKGHTAAARHLCDAFGIAGWYSQGIVVAYERARGVRAVNQRCDGAFEVSVSKVMAGDAATIIKALTDPRQRARLRPAGDGPVRALAAALGTPASKGFVLRPDGLGRFRYKWGDTTVEFSVVPKDAKKVSVVVTNAKLASGAMVEERRAAWREMLNSLASIVTRTSATSDRRVC